MTLLKLLLLLVTAAVAMWRLHPQVGPGDTPVQLEAMKRHVTQIAREPHPVGSQANQQVRDYLLSEFEALGLSPQVRPHTVESWRGEHVTVENILCTIPGVADGPSVYLVTHYDSARQAPGAGDAAASVAAVLETARLLAQSPPAYGQVVVLITDGEEAGLLGAQGWAFDRARYPRADLVLNFEARGSAGPSVMFETSRLGRNLLGDYAAGTRQPVTSSLADEVYRRMPNGTDFTIFAMAGVPGLNFAFLDGFHRYHTPADSPENLSDASLLHHAQQVHGVVRRVTASPEGFNDEAAEPLVFFDLLALGVVRYPAHWALVAGLAALLLVAAAWWRRRPSIAGTTRAIAAYALALLALAGWAQLLAYLLGLVVEPATFREANAGLWPIFLILSAVVLGVTLVAGRLMRTTSDERAGGVALLFALAAVGAALVLPGGSYLFTWPALLLGIAALLPTGRARELALVAAAIGATVILLPIAWLVSVALTVGLISPAVALLGLLAWTWVVALDRGQPSSTMPPAAAASPPAVASRRFIRK